MSLSRRTFLRGLGASVALPFLDAMRPGLVFAQGTPPALVAPKRFLAWFVPCGIHMPAWTPAGAGDLTLTPILEPLRGHRDQLLVLSGLNNLPSRPDGPGDHAAGTAGFLTATHVHKTEGADIENDVSVDQLLAQQLGEATRFPSLVLGLEGGGNVGGCDSGYSCAYSRNISWAGPRTPAAKGISPRAVFDRLFGGSNPAATREQMAKRRRYQKSILDFVKADADRLHTKLGATDKTKMDEYLTGVRELEHRLDASAMAPVCGAGAAPTPGDLPDQVRHMNDLMALAFQCDLTRFATFMLGNGGSNRPYPFLNVNDGHHQLSHHQDNAVWQAQLQVINTWEVEQFAYLVDRLARMEEGDGSVIDNSALFFSSEIEDGNSHAHTNLPVLLAGRAGGALRPGRHVAYRNRPPVANLFVSLIRAMGGRADTFGDDGVGPLAILEPRPRRVRLAAIMSRARLFLLGALLAAACGEAPAPGESGGECRVGPEPCDEGLACDQGECADPPEDAVVELTADDIAVEMKLDKREVIGDGLDSVIARFSVTRAGTDKEPFPVEDLKTVLVRSNPQPAATPAPGEVELKDGLGATRLQTCHTRLDAQCPRSFYVELALSDRPTVIIYRSELVRVRPAGSKPRPEAE